MNKPINTVLFDLDGTLLDTYRDLAAALNQVLQNHDRNPMSHDALRPFVSKGAMVMVCIAFRCLPTSTEAKALWKEVIDVYAQNISQHTEFFPGMESVLQDIENKGLQWGIVTNKPGHLTDMLLRELDLDQRPGIVVSGDTLPVKKPNPEPLLHACYKLKSRPEQCVYIGDDERDIQAGKAADMRTVAAAYGYIVAEEDPSDWAADAVIQSASELTPLLERL